MFHPSTNKEYELLANPTEGYVDTDTQTKHEYQSSTYPFTPTPMQSQFNPEATDYLTSKTSKKRKSWVRGTDGRKSMVSKRHQARKLFWPMLADLIIHIALWASLTVVMIVTKQEGVLEKRGKYIYNICVLAIPLLISMHFTAAFKKFAAAVRWKLLQLGQYTADETDMIISLTSFGTVLKLGWHWSSKGGTGRQYFRAFMCYVWILVMLASQVSLGMLGLVVELKGEGALLTRSGLAKLSVLDNFYFRPSADPQSTEKATHGILSDQQNLAHRWGDASFELYRKGQYRHHTSDESFNPTYGTLDISLNNTSDWVYRFRDWTFKAESDGDPSVTLTVASKRHVDITTTCDKYNLEGFEIQGFPPHRLNYTWAHPQHPRISEELALPAGVVTVFTPDNNLVENYPEGTKDLIEYYCGNTRCATLGVYAMDNTVPGKGLFYECNVTVSELRFSAKEIQELPDFTARLAAGSMAWDGLLTNAYELWPQYMPFRNSSLWGKEVFRVQEATDIAKIVGAFTAGTLAGADTHNPKVDHPGLQVIIGVQLEIKGLWLYIIMGCFIVVHIIFMVISILYGCSVLQRDDAILSHAMFLRPITNSFQNAHSTAGKEQLLEHVGDTKYFYGAGVVLSPVIHQQ